ncbi:VWA domain-containing protein [Rubripirellula amarantea]|nr:VWA domain-containing protein [Rubripirellula amarantea]
MAIHRTLLCLCLLWSSCLPTISLSGYAAETTSTRLVARLAGRSDEARIRAIAEVSRTVQRKYQALPELKEAAELLIAELSPEDQLSISTVTLIYTLGTIDRKEAEESLISMLDSRHTDVVLIAADVLGKNKFHNSIETIYQLKDHPAFTENYGFRFNLIRALAQMQHPRAIELLTQWRHEFDGQLRHEIKKLLTEVDVRDFGGDEKRFNAWQRSMSLEGSVSPDEDDMDAMDENLKATNPAQIKLYPASHASDSPNRVELSKSSQYYGIDIHAKRLMFIIDHSGSMEEYWDGLSRLQRAKSELIKTIEELDPRSEFALMFYATDVHVWKSTLLLANDQNKREAIAFVKRLQYGDRTNTYGALKNAIEFDQQLEAVFLLTDGQPTIGDVVKPAEIVQDIMQRNRFRHLKFNTIGIAINRSTEAFLSAIAEQSGGEYRAAN